MATKETHFMFNNKIYDQIDGVAMGSPLAHVLAIVFMCKFEEDAFSSFIGISPSFYRRYVDDSFLIFDRKESVKPFFDYLNSLHPNIKFTKEEENNEHDFFPFLDIKIKRCSNKFVTQTYYKPTYTGLYTNWNSLTPRAYKINLVKCLLFRAFKI